MEENDGKEVVSSSFETADNIAETETEAANVGVSEEKNGEKPLENAEASARSGELTAEERLHKSRKTTLRVIWCIVAAILLGIVIWLVVDAGIKPEVSVSDGRLIVKDTYPAEIALEGAVVEYVDTPAIYETSNSASVGKRRKGRFVVTETSLEVYMSVMNVERKSIKISSGKEVYYINLGDDTATEELLGKIREAAGV